MVQWSEQYLWLGRVAQCSGQYRLRGDGCTVVRTRKWLSGESTRDCKRWFSGWRSTDCAAMGGSVVRVAPTVGRWLSGESTRGCEGSLSGQSSTWGLGSWLSGQSTWGWGGLLNGLGSTDCRVVGGSVFREVPEAGEGGSVVRAPGSGTRVAQWSRQHRLRGDGLVSGESTLGWGVWISGQSSTCCLGMLLSSLGSTDCGAKGASVVSAVPGDREGGSVVGAVPLLRQGPSGSGGVTSRTGCWPRTHRSSPTPPPRNCPGAAHFASQTQKTGLGWGSVGGAPWCQRHKMGLGSQVGDVFHVTETEWVREAG